MAESAGFSEQNITEKALAASPNKYLKMVTQQMAQRDPNMHLIHPMYVKLQELSPMGMMREYTIPEVDMTANPMDV